MLHRELAVSSLVSQVRRASMDVLHRLHFRTAHQTRIGNLARAFAELIPAGPKQVLDVGSGDGLLASRVTALRPELTMHGVDIVPRREAYIEVDLFDGTTLPFADRSFDVVTFSDVLHHATDQRRLLAEASRVTRAHVAIKDHLRESKADELVLRAMDYVGNRHNEVPLPYDYWSARTWRDELARAGLSVERFEDRVRVYPPWLSVVIGRGLHVLILATPA
jgi:SAM-dependent methyltransferase